MLQSFTVLPIPTPIKSPFVTLTGAKDPTISKVYVNGVSDGVNFVTPSTWEFDYHLSAGVNTITLQAEDVAGNKSEVIILSPEIPKVTPSPESYFNALDDKGSEIGLERLPGEKNLYYKNRVLDADKNLGNATYEGLIRALSREVSLDITEDVFKIVPVEDTTSRVLRATNAFVTIEPTRLLVEADQLRQVKEKLRLDPGSRQTTLSKIPTSKAELTLQGKDGRALDAGDFELFEEKKVRLLKDGLPLTVFATYRHFHDISITAATTLSGLKTSLETAIGVETKQLFTVTITSGYTAKLAKFLLRPIRAPVARSGLSLHLSQVQVTAFSDEKYREGLLNQHGTYISTKLETYAGQTRAKGRIFLKDTVLDQDNLIEFDTEEDLVALPHLFDPLIRHHVCQDPTDAGRYTDRDAKRGPNLCPRHPTLSLSPKGLRKVDLQSGPGASLRMVKVK